MNNNQADNFPVFDPFAAAPQGGQIANANSVTTMQQQPKAISQIQFRSSLQVKQEAKIQAEKQKEEALLASLQTVDLTTTPAFGQQQQQQLQSSSLSLNDNNNDPFAHLANMPLKQMSFISSQNKSKGKNDDDDDDDDDGKIPIPDDPVLYQAREAALYAEEILKQEAAARQKQSQQGLNEFWNKAQGLFKTTTTTTSQTNAGQDGEKTKLNQKQSAKQEPQHSATTPQTPSAAATFSYPVSTVPTTPQAYPSPYNNNNNNNNSIPAMNATAVAVPHNTSHAAAPYVTATAPTVVPVPRPTTTSHYPQPQPQHASSPTITTMPAAAAAAAAANNNNDQSHIPWYARKHPQEQQKTNDDNDDSSRVPWYSRAPPPPSQRQSAYSVSVADQEYQDPNANNHNKAPWYGDRGGGEQSASSLSSEKKGMGSVMGATALGGVVGLVALGPLAGVAAAGGLAYAAATKQGAVGDVARGAGNLVAAAVNATRGSTKKERESSSYRPNSSSSSSSSGPLI